MQGIKLFSKRELSKKNSYANITHQLLDTSTPLNYSIEYLLGNYGDKAVPALMQALPARPWYEKQIIFEALGKLGDISAIVPLCSLLYADDGASKQTQSMVAYTLKSILYYCSDKKFATKILIDTMLRYDACVEVISKVLQDQKDKYLLKNAYKKLALEQRYDLRKAAIEIIGVEEGFIEYRIKLLKKILSKNTDPKLNDSIISYLKVLITKKRCQCLCNKKGFKFDAFFHRPDDKSYDCCCVDKSNKRILIKFEGGVIHPSHGNTSAKQKTNEYSLASHTKPIHYYHKRK